MHVEHGSKQQNTCSFHELFFFFFLNLPFGNMRCRMSTTECIKGRACCSHDN